jgi:hypothetical protein
MSAYTLLRLAHSYWRWVVLVSAVVVLVRMIVGVLTRSEWTGADEGSVRRFLTAADFQMLIGVILYFGFSPFWLATYQSFHETMSSQVSRFFGVEHQTAMLLALVAAHVGRARAKRAVVGAKKYRAMLIAMLIFFALVLWAIPWPWRVVGRPLLRTTL